MLPLAQLKKELNYSQDLADIIEALKLIASAQFSLLSSQMEKKDVVKDRIASCFKLLTSISRTNPFFVEKKGIPGTFLMVCSDEGFLGEVNAHVVDTALTRGLKENSNFIVLGERGARILKDSGVKFTSFSSVPNEIKTRYISEISDYILDLYKKAKMSALYVVYMKFISFTSHHIDIIKLLPCDQLVGYLEQKETPHMNTLIEPSPDYVIEYLVKLWLVNNLHNIFWSSKLSEWSVRVMNLEHSSDELKQINRDLRFRYFKAVHSLNDKVIREIFAARTLL